MHRSETISSDLLYLRQNFCRKVVSYVFLTQVPLEVRITNLVTCFKLTIVFVTLLNSIVSQMHRARHCLRGELVTRCS
jgi:hypothetical protein